MEEKDKIKNRFQVFFDYIVSKQGNIEGYNELKKAVDDAYNKNDIRGLREINKELNVWLVEMFPPKEKKEIREILKEKLGENFEQTDLKNLEKINKIIKRGKVNTQKEYALLQQRIEEIYTDKSRKLEVLEINKLLADFHK